MADDDTDNNPATAPVRGPDGRFVGSKPKEEKSEKELPEEELLKNEAEEDSNDKTQSDIKSSKKKVKHDIRIVRFGGVPIKKVLYEEKCLFAFEDILKLGKSDIPIGTIEDIRERNEDVDKLIKDNEVMINDILYLDSKTLAEIIRTMSAKFPGSIVGWLDDVSKMTFDEHPGITLKEHLQNLEPPLQQ